jgi:hypothetical protein
VPPLLALHPAACRVLLRAVREMSSSTQKGKKTVEITALVHKDTPACCRATVLDFAVKDRYMGGGEPGDQIACGCGNKIVYAPTGGRFLGWKVAA